MAYIRNPEAFSWLAQLPAAPMSADRAQEQRPRVTITKPLTVLTAPGPQATALSTPMFHRPIVLAGAALGGLILLDMLRPRRKKGRRR